jgi:uncharacterized protein YwqG
MNLRDDLIAKLQEAKLGRIAAGVADLGKPSFRLRTARAADEEIPVGASKLGGLPDLPAGCAWPSNSEKELAFIAQINLAHLPDPGPGPREGLLSFFYDADQSAWGFDPKQRSHWEVLFFDSAESLQRIEQPASLVRPKGFMERLKALKGETVKRSYYNPLAVSFAPFLSIPDTSSNALQEILVAEDEAEQDEEAYGDFRSSYPFDGSAHQLFGWPSPIQNEMELECQLASNGLYVGDATGYDDPRAESLRQGAADWMLLLQIDSDDDANMMWGDAGMIYYWIRRADLEQRRFDKTWFILQCF